MPPFEHRLLDTLVDKVDFNLATRVFRQCLGNTSAPRGYGHVEALDQLMSASLEPDARSALEAAYTMAVAQAFLIDEISDGQTGAHEATLLPILKSLEMAFLVEAVPHPVHVIALNLILRGNADQLIALEKEKESWTTWKSGSGEGDIDHVLGRSAAVLTYLDIVRLVSKRDEADSVRPLVEEFLRLVQYCDDLSDWEDDLSHGRITPVIAHRLRRVCSEAINSNMMHTLLLREMYVNGGMQFELKSVIMEFDALLARVIAVSPSAVLFLEYVRRFRELARQNLSTLLSEETES